MHLLIVKKKRFRWWTQISVFWVDSCACSLAVRSSLVLPGWVNKNVYTRFWYNAATQRAARNVCHTGRFRCKAVSVACSAVDPSHSKSRCLKSRPWLKHIKLSLKKIKSSCFSVTLPRRRIRHYFKETKKVKCLYNHITLIRCPPTVLLGLLQCKRDSFSHEQFPSAQN